MKKIISTVLLLALALSLVACTTSEPREISCEEILKAYKDAGYSNVFHVHSEEELQISGRECYIIVYANGDSYDSGLAQISIFQTEEGAKAAAEEHRYTVINWIFAAILGEGRWLRSGQYGKIEYSSYDPELLQPLKDLMK